MSRPRIVVALTALALLVLAAATLVPGLTRERRAVASTVTPQPLFGVAPIALEPDAELCVDDVTLTPRTQIAQVVLAAPARGTADVRLVADGTGYRSPPVEVRAGEGSTVLEWKIVPPRRQLFGRVCLENRGARALSLIGTTEFRTQSRSVTSRDGEVLAEDLSMTLFEPRAASLLDSFGSVLDRATAFRGFLGHAWIAWTLVVLTVIGVPLAVLYVLLRALEAEG